MTHSGSCFCGAVEIEVTGPARRSPSRGEFRQEAAGNVANAIAAVPAATMFLLFVNKTRQAQTFFATIEHNH